MLLKKRTKKIFCLQIGLILTFTSIACVYNQKRKRNTGLKVDQRSGLMGLAAPFSKQTINYII